MEDPLTGLFNRESLFSLVHRQIQLAIQQNSRLGLLVIDINDFSKLNNIYGYGTGDELLRKLAGILKETRRPFDFAARIGDDRFALVLPNLLNPGHAELAAHKLHRLLEIPFAIDAGPIRVSVTVGIAICPDHATNTDNLLKKAELALYVATRSQQPTYLSAESAIRDVSTLWDLELELDNAFRDNEFELHYQPKISLTTGKPVGAEALIRWNSPKRGMVFPDQFIPIVEEAGLMKQLTAWVINSALRQSLDWTDKWGPLSVSVNVPPEIVLQTDFVDTLTNAIGLWKGTGEQLVIEITEQTLASDPDRVFQLLSNIRDLGVKVSIDDFGTGYSSLGYFKRFPASELKIDKSFVAGLLQDQTDADIVHLIIDLAHRFEMEVVAEGVEDLETLKTLARQRCDIAQGYLISKPLPHRVFLQWLEAFRGLKSTPRNQQTAESAQGPASQH